MSKNQDPWWVGVKHGVGRPPHDVFQRVEEEVTPEAYPQYTYTVGPFGDRDKANDYALKHVNKDLTFTDPFCNDGKGR